MAKLESLGHFEQLVLTAVLLLKQGAYAVSIHRRMEELTHPKPVSVGAVYTTLDRLEIKGLLTSGLTEPARKRGGRPKRCYTLTAGGECALQDSVVAAKRLCAVLEEQWGESR